MEKTKTPSKKRRDPLPQSFRNLDELGNFWDTHDSSDYEEYMKPVDFEVDLKRRVYWVSLPSELDRKVRSIAKKKGLSIESLLNHWIQDKAA